MFGAVWGCRWGRPQGGPNILMGSAQKSQGQPQGAAKANIRDIILFLTPLLDDPSQKKSQKNQRRVGDKTRNEIPLSSARHFVHASEKRLSFADPRHDDHFLSSAEFEESKVQHRRFNACLSLCNMRVKINAFLALSSKKTTRHMCGNDAR